jgi:hypothetical protein
MTGSCSLPYGTLMKKVIVMAFGAYLSIFIVITTWLVCLQSGSTSDDLPRSSRVGPLGVPLISYERIPIATVLAHPDQYQMREIRLTGSVTAIQIETIMNPLICGRAHERTTFMMEDDSGKLEVIDQGACGRNVSSLKAPMLKIGQLIDLLVLIVLARKTDQPEMSLEVTLRFLETSRD